MSGDTAACKNFDGSLNRDGYGVLPKAIHGSRLAHRAALAEKLGRPVDGHALHHCDNPPCIEPSHLYEGSPLDNAADAKARGRARGGRWNQVHCAYGHALTADNVRLKRNRRCRDGYERCCRTCERRRSTENNDRRRGVARKRASAHV